MATDRPFGHLKATGRGQQVEVVAPTHCRQGHPLKRVTVSFVRCDCDKARDGGHYSWKCWCSDLQYGDGHVDDALLVQAEPPRM